MPFTSHSPTTHTSVIRARKMLERYMNTTIRITNFKGEVVLETKCRYQPVTVGVQHTTSDAVYIYRDVRLQCPWDTDTTGVVPDMEVEIIDSPNERLIGRGGIVTWAQDSDFVLERTILMKADMRERS